MRIHRMIAVLGLGLGLLATPSAALAFGLTYTLGGPRIDQGGRVVDPARHPIPGLYAAGTTAGGLGGGPKPVTAGGIGIAVPLGFLAGEHAATDRGDVTIAAAG